MSITTIQKDYLCFGMIRYFHSNRCINNTHIKEFKQWKITANELVTFDCGLMEMEGIEKSEIVMPKKNRQILAIIIRPEIEINHMLEMKNQFRFCGYDLVDN